jgi:cytidylate kinase
LDNEDVTQAIRAPQIDKNISDVCKIKKVREYIVALARKIARNYSCVTEGRDTTTVIFPAAEFKFYLDADYKVRAERRYGELSAKGINISREEVAADLKRRDEADMSRTVGPLKKSADAQVIDTTAFSIDEVVRILAEKITSA